MILTGTRRNFVSVVPRWVPIIVYHVMLCTLAGCGTPEPPEGRSAVQDLAKWYGKYRLGNAGKPPANEEAFVQYIRKRLAREGVEFDVDKMLVSPRDGQKLVVTYGKPISNRPELNLVVHEKEGYRGQKWAAFETGVMQQVDDAKLQELMSPHTNPK